ncbi:SagB family peptide dehydrogenase [Paenibacillus aurantius]|uniref:SagB family peptide dehydrogenase n=1 Tax=Paenibacillus aurantius TaxID=2918900 RepID=A0AA96RF95_9BACL|nr:SagB family peptide dehydrogenase [Paenibacillus aurantius]WNQ13345.1 SagB family peptide dehydrogenase [Paenibacillus aurantius]
MNLDTFVHNLHFEPDLCRPPGKEVDWEDAPLKYKLYPGLPAFPLPYPSRRTRAGEVLRAPSPSLEGLGTLLWYGYGVSRFGQSVWEGASPGERDEGMWSIRRFVPSGGGLYPCELYAYLKLEEIPHGVYHYDAAHHRLVLLREGDFDDYVGRALGDRSPLPGFFGTLFVSVVFRKNYFKYYDFAYRLQGLDAGALLGQLLTGAERLGFAAELRYRYLDRAVHHLIGIKEEEESVYAVLPLSAHPAPPSREREGESRGETATGLCRELPPLNHVTYNRCRKELGYPELTRMNEASRMETFVPLDRMGEASDLPEGELVELPTARRASFDWEEACRHRHSPGMGFTLRRRLKATELALLLREACQGFTREGDRGTEGRSHQTERPPVDLYGCMYGVEGIPDGAYRYDTRLHVLVRIRSGDQRAELQRGMALDNVNLCQVPLVFHPSGDLRHSLSRYGYRGYRIQQMEAGILLQRLLLSASASGMNGHPLLGYDSAQADRLYALPGRGQTSLIQVPVGFSRPRAQLEGSLHP